MAFKKITPAKASELKDATRVIYKILEQYHVGEVMENGWDILSAEAGKLFTRLHSEGY